MKNVLAIFLATGGVFDPGAVNTQMAVQGASLNMFGGERFFFTLHTSIRRCSFLY